MPSQFFGLNIAYKGLLASNAALNTTSNNIANVQTTGYSRQQVVQQASDALRVFQTYGCAGAGVDTLAIERVRNEFYDHKFWEANTNYGQFSMKSYYMAQLENYFADDQFTTGFKTIFDRFMVQGLQEILKNAGSTTAKAQFVGYGDNLTDYFNELATNLEKVQKDANDEIKMRVDQINSLAQEIATLNKQINVIELTGSKANELRDRRTLLLDQLSEIVDIETQEIPIVDNNNPDRETGAHRFLVKIGGGQLLLDTGEYNELECVARKSYEKVNQTDIDGLYDVYWKNGDRFNLYNPRLGGALQGLVEMRDGNNGENFTGTVTGTGSKTVTDPDGVTRNHDTVTIQVGKNYLQDLNKCNLSDSGGIINIGNQEFYYDSWSYTCTYDDNGEPVYSYTFVLSNSELNPRHITNDRVGKVASIGTGIAYQGIPYYMSQMNEWVRTFAQKFNDLLNSGYDGYNKRGCNMFTGNRAANSEQYDFPDEFRYDWYYGKTRDEVLQNLKDTFYDQIYADKYMEFWNESYNNADLTPDQDEIDSLAQELEEKYLEANPDKTPGDVTQEQRDEFARQAREQVTNDTINAARKAAGEYAEEQMKDPDVLAQVEQDALDAAEASFDGTSFTMSSTDDSYYRLTAKNFAILSALIQDADLLATRKNASDGVDQYDLLTALGKMATDKSMMSFRGCNAGEFLQCILSDVALNASNANTFCENYRNITTTIDNQRESISGVDEDEEAVNLVKYQNGYNLAAKMVQTLTEIYDRLILQTGV
ncbi:MAG: flagellar hook-associated protein FlgK [Lachnospiraceae bacterium]|nr:flagellar hook-associated protein FlgK [Lachnospiraceae bacterium]